MPDGLPMYGVLRQTLYLQKKSFKLPAGTFESPKSHLELEINFPDRTFLINCQFAENYLPKLPIRYEIFTDDTIQMPDGLPMYGVLRQTLYLQK